MWQIICPWVDFSKKYVLDLGCGHGDILRKIRLDDRQDTSRTGLWGIDIEYPGEWHSGHSTYVSQDINKWVESNKSFPDTNDWERADIAMCFSVLSYLNDIPATLKWMANNFELSLIEAQYIPEIPNIGVSSDVDMKKLLLDNNFSDVLPLGMTIVENSLDADVQIRRTIWMCK